MSGDKDYGAGTEICGSYDMIVQYIAVSLLTLDAKDPCTYDQGMCHFRLTLTDYILLGGKLVPIIQRLRHSPAAQ
jgi:hypothetical protein